MVQQRHDRHVILLSGKRPRLPSYIRSSKSPDVMAHPGEHLSDKQIRDAEGELRHADQQLETQSRYPRRTPDG